MNFYHLISKTWILPGIGISILILFTIDFLRRPNALTALKHIGEENIIHSPWRTGFVSALFVLLGITWISLYTHHGVWNAILGHKHLGSKFSYKITLDVIRDITSTLLFAVLYALSVILINAGLVKLIQYEQNDYSSIILSLGRALKAIVFLILFNEALSFFQFPVSFEKYLQQFNQVFIIAIIGWSLLQAIQTGEVIFLKHNRKYASDNLSARRNYTHVVILKRILIVLLSVMTVAAILMTFDRIKVAGRTVLTSAGILATIVGLSAKGVIDSIFQGLQLAIAQPIRINDTVTINGEIGTVTAINLNHVIVTLADRSQMIVPTKEFLDKSFRNWTHCSENLLGIVLLYVTYKMPVEVLRNKFKELLAENDNWDKNTNELSVSDIKNNLVELKLVMSAKNSRHLAQLTNHVREKLLEYMQANYPNELP